MAGRTGRRQVASLIRQATERLAALGLPPTFTVTQLCQRIEDHRGRSLQLIARELPAAAPHGLWIAGEHADYVFYDCTAVRVRQHQIIGHELGHMLLDDTATSTDHTDLVAVLAPDVDPATLRNLQQRSSYEQFAERRAEVFGSIVVQRTDSWSALPDRPTDAIELVRLRAVLEGGR